MNSTGSGSDIPGFFSREYEKLKRYAASRLSRFAEEEPAEIVHEVLTGLLDKPDLTIPIGELGAYVYMSIRNRIIDRWRRRQRRGDQDNEFIGEISDDHSHFIAELEQSEQYSLLEEAMDNLNESERMVVEATELDGFTYRELEEMWDVPAGTLMSRKKRALDKMKEYCKEEQG